MFDSITVRDLINELENYPDDMMVAVGVNYGDYGQTMQAIDVGENFGTYRLYSTAYSQTGYAVDVDQDHEDVTEEVLIINQL